MLPAGEPTSPAGRRPATPLYHEGFTGDTGPAAAADSGPLLVAAAVSLVPVEPRHTCAMGGHHSGARLHSLLGMVSRLGSASRVHVVVAGLHAWSPVGTATSSLAGGHVTLQLRAAEHEVAWLVAVVAGAWTRTTTSTATPTMLTCKTST